MKLIVNCFGKKKYFDRKLIFFQQKMALIMSEENYFKAVYIGKINLNKSEIKLPLEKGKKPRSPQTTAN